MMGSLEAWCGPWTDTNHQIPAALQEATLPTLCEARGTDGQLGSAGQELPGWESTLTILASHWLPWLR